MKGRLRAFQRASAVLTEAGARVAAGAIGRLVPDDVAGLVRYVREHAATSA